MTLRNKLTKATQFVLGFDGVLHLLECFTAFHEKAWITFGITTFHTLVFFLAVYLVGKETKVPNWEDNKPGPYGHDN
tara:strand:+ start:2575 stop:2805 length:231 start_codon:yes stop_codon:yes gene_type:complete